MSVELNSPLLALDEFSETDEWGEEGEFEFREEDRIYLAEEYRANVGGMMGIRYEGDDQSYVRLSDLFSLNGMLDKQHRAIYLEAEEGSTIVRVEQDGTWIKVEAPYPDFDEYDGQMTRGRVDHHDFETSMMYSDGTLGEPVVVFGFGFGPLSTIEAITTVPAHPWEKDSGLLQYYEEVDVVKNFQEYVTAASKNPANWGMSEPLV